MNALARTRCISQVLVVFLLASRYYLNALAQEAVGEKLESVCHVESNVEGLPVFGKIFKYRILANSHSERPRVFGPLLEVLIDNRSYQFIVDAGANYSTFNENTFSRDIFEAYSDNVKARTPIKPELVLKVFTIDGAAGGFALNDDGNEVSGLFPYFQSPVEGERGDKINIDGSLGIGFLEKKQVWSSVKTGSFALLVNARAIPSHWRNAIECDVAQDRFQFVSVGIGGTNYRCKLCSGANRSDIDLELSTFKRLADGGKIRKVTEGTYSSAYRQYDILQGVLDEIEIDGVHIKNALVRSAPEGSHNRINLAAFRDSDVLFDVENNKLYLSKEP